MDVDERVGRLEAEILELKCLVEKLTMLARVTPKGRMMLKLLGLS